MSRRTVYIRWYLFWVKAEKYIDEIATTQIVRYEKPYSSFTSYYCLN